MFDRMDIYCCICRTPIDGLKAYGREGVCCGKTCYDEYELRRACAVLNKPYERKEPKREGE